MKRDRRQATGDGRATVIPSGGRGAAEVEGSAFLSIQLVLLLATLALNPLRIPAQSGTSGMPELRAMIAAADARIRTACPSDHPDDRSALLADERRIAAAVDDAGDADTWLRLACARALLHAADAIAHDGPLMALGDSWFSGATRALFHVLEERPGDSTASHLLGQLMLDENIPPGADSAAILLASSVRHGVRDVAALRGCTALSHRARRHDAATRCAEAALTAGRDSTWQLLHLAWLRFDAGDTTGGVQRFNRALASARDSTDWDDVGWHLRWFLEPDEEATWDTLPGGDRAAWVRDRFASRDVRDGRAPGSRMAEHFARLDTVEARFRVQVPLREFDRLLGPATPDDLIGSGNVAHFSDPALVAARPWRYFRRLHQAYDDRAAVWMRWGQPKDRIPWSGCIFVGPSRIPGRCSDRSHDPTACRRQLRHRYVRPTRLAPEHARRVALCDRWASPRPQLRRRDVRRRRRGHPSGRGRPWTYFCGIDVYRCGLTRRASSMPQPINPEVIETLRFADRKTSARRPPRMTTPIRVEHPISVAAALSRIWDPRSGVPLAVIPYAIKVGDVERSEDSTGITATIALTLRQWDPVKASWQATDVVRRLRLPDKLRKSSHLTGYLVTPTSTGVSAWSLVAQQGDDRRGRAWEDNKSAPDAGPLRLSDLILGAASQGEQWTTTSGRAVPLAPLGTFDRKEPVSVYWQVRSTVPRGRSVSHTSGALRGRRPG